jgi:predicted alpha/beta-hydrolase family hydrolase
MKADVLITHDADASIQSPWMKNLELSLGKLEIESYFFNFPYMAKSLIEQRRIPPSNIELLENYYVDVLESFNQEIVIGGKSMGGRVATRISHHPHVKKIVCFGFPFFKQTNNSEDDYSRIEDLLSVEKPVLIFQGTTDPMGGFEKLSSIKFPSNFSFQWVPGADHDLKFKGKIPFDFMAKHLKSFISQ